MPVSLSITLNEAQRKKLSEAFKDPDLIKEPLSDFLHSSGLEIVAEARQKSPVDTGRYRGSIAHEVDIGAGTVRVGTNVEYATVIEYGQKPGKWPPAEPIEKWAQRHGIRDRGAFYLIRRAIFRRGIEEKKTLTNALNDSKGPIKRHFKALANAIEKQWDKKANTSGLGGF